MGLLKGVTPQDMDFATPASPNQMKVMDVSVS